VPRHRCFARRGFPVRYPVRNLVWTVVSVHFLSRVFPPALHDPRADKKRSGFGFEGGAHCTAPASSWFAGQALRAIAEFL
jgi:hypothetical protein